MNNIFVTGGNGLVGSRLYEDKNVLKPNHRELDLTRYDDVKSYFLAHPEIDTVIHTAARVGGIKANMDFPADSLHRTY